MNSILSSNNSIDFEFNFNDNGVNPDNISILFNFMDTSIEQFPNFEKLKDFSKHIVYNFPKAENIRVDNINIYGTILAPAAKVVLSNINSLNAQIISKELTITNSNMEELVVFDGLFHDNDGDPITLDLIAGYVRKTQLDSNKTENLLGEPLIENDSDDETIDNGDDDNDVQEVNNDEDGNVEEVNEDKDNDHNDNVLKKVDPKPSNLSDYACKTDDNPLGIVSKFGAFSFGDFLAYNSDVQGRIASKNLVDVSSYSINEKVYGSNTYKCNQSPLKEDFQFSVVASTVKIINSHLYNGGIAYTNNVDQTDESLKTSIISNGCSITNDSSIIDFDTVESQMNYLSENLAKLEDNGAVNK